jgi:hypothetical protein
MPAEDQRNANLHPQNFSTNEQTRPLPVFAGTQRIGSTHLTDMWALNGTRLGLKTGNYYYATFGLAHGRGVVDKIYKILWDNEIIWEGEVTRDAFHPDWIDIPITWNATGTVRWYWGTSTQAADTILALDPKGVHPAYRGMFYSRYGNAQETHIGGVKIGQNKATPPNVEIIAGRWPKPGWWAAAVDGDGYPKIGNDINPAAFIAELLQDPIFGLGLVETRIDTGSFNDAGDTLAAEGFGISPLITRRQGLRQILADVFAIIDGHLFANADGTIGLNLIRDPGIYYAATLDESKLADAVTLDADGWAQTENALALAYLNAATEYNGETAQFIDRGNYAITGITRSVTLQRPWITSQALAQKVALAVGARMGIPQMRATLKVRKSIGVDLTPGQPFKLTSTEQGLANVLMRVREQTLPKPNDPPVVTVLAEMDRSYLNTEYYSPVEGTFTPAGFSADPAPMAIMEWPWMREHDVPMLALLIARTTGLATGFFAHMRRPSGSYELIGFSNGYAMHGAVVDANYSATTADLDDMVGMVVQFDEIDQVMENVSINDALLDELLVVVGGEICSAFNATLLAAGKYRIYLARARYDTVKAAHNIGAVVWVFYRKLAAFFPAENTIQTQTWKMQQIIDRVAEDLGTVTAVTLTTVGRFWRPLEPGALAAFGNAVNPTYTTGQDIPLTWAVRNERKARYWDEASLDGGAEWTEDVPDTVLEVWQGGVLKHTVEIALAPAGSFIDAIDSYLILNANLVAWLGAELTFDVRAYGRRDGYRSTRYVALTVTKV